MAFAASVRSNTAQVPYSFVKEQPQFTTALRKELSLPILIRGMVEVNGLEPMTSCVQGRRSPS